MLSQLLDRVIINSGSIVAHLTRESFFNQRENEMNKELKTTLEKAGCKVAYMNDKEIDVLSIFGHLEVIDATLEAVEEYLNS